MPSITRRHLLGAIGASALQAAETRPNIVLILADDLGIGDLGCYGQKLLKTPNIDRLAAEGLQFRNAYAGAMVCAPSRCSLQTGYHMGHATVRGNWEVYPEGQYPLAERDVTIGAALKKAGYATGVCGKWGLGGPDSRSAPNRAGYDFFYGYNCQRHAHRYFTDYLWRNTERVSIPQSAAKRIYSQDLIAEESLRFIRENRGRPFHLFCSWTVPHGLYNRENVVSIDKYAHTGWTEPEKAYAAMVERLDSDVGRVTTLLSELGLDRNTLVLFASDNGAGGGVTAGRFGSRGGLRDAKGSLWEGGVHVPLIARWPGKVPAGRATDFSTAFWDLLPTFAELAGTSAPRGIDGISIVPTLLGRAQKPHEYLYWERGGGTNKMTRAVRLGDWKGYQETPGSPVELYDLKSDPAESHNVAAGHSGVVDRVRKIMAAAHTDVVVPTPDKRIWEKYKEDNKRLDEMLSR